MKKLIIRDGNVHRDNGDVFTILRKEYAGNIYVESINSLKTYKTRLYYCEDTLVEHPAWFMLKDEIWNEITPDFNEDYDDELKVNKGILSVGACNSRALKYLKRPLYKNDFKLDDVRNQTIIFGYELCIKHVERNFEEFETDDIILDDIDSEY